MDDKTYKECMKVVDEAKLERQRKEQLPIPIPKPTHLLSFREWLTAGKPRNIRY